MVGGVPTQIRTPDFQNTNLRFRSMRQPNPQIDVIVNLTCVQHSTNLFYKNTKIEEGTFQIRNTVFNSYTPNFFFLLNHHYGTFKTIMKIKYIIYNQKKDNGLPIHFNSNYFTSVYEIKLGTLVVMMRALVVNKAERFIH